MYDVSYAWKHQHVVLTEVSSCLYWYTEVIYKRGETEMKQVREKIGTVTRKNLSAEV